MKVRLLFCVTVAAVAVLSACKKSPSSQYGKDEPIKGSRSDPPVTMQAGWGASNRYHFHLESISAVEEPRRNTRDTLTRETTFGQDFALAVTNVSPDGRRILEMEIQGVQLDSAVGDRVTINFNSGTENLDLNNAPLSARLQKLTGSRLAVHLSPENKVTRIDGLREINNRLNDRQTNGPARNVMRGAISTVLNRFFSQPFWKDMLELNWLPTNEVRVGDTWALVREMSAGPAGARMSAELAYTFKGWQQHDGRLCARLEFNGTLKPAPRGRDILRNLAQPPPDSPAPGEEGTITGVTWFSPEIGLPVETVFDQSFTTKVTTSTSSRRIRVTRGTNAAGEIVALTNAPAAPESMTMTNALPETFTFTSTSRQHVSLKLVDVTPFGPPGTR